MLYKLNISKMAIMNLVSKVQAELIEQFVLIVKIFFNFMKTIEIVLNNYVISISINTIIKDNNLQLCLQQISNQFMRTMMLECCFIQNKTFLRCIKKK